MGASSTHPLGATRGAASYTSTAHTHSINLPSYWTVLTAKVAATSSNSLSNVYCYAGEHSHNSITSDSGGSSISKGEPPYYALNHIIKSTNIRAKIGNSILFFTSNIQNDMVADTSVNGKFIVGASIHPLNSTNGSSTVVEHSHTVSNNFTTIRSTAASTYVYIDTNSSTKLSFIYDDSEGTSHSIGSHSHTCASPTSSVSVTVIPNYITKIFAYVSHLNVRGDILKGIILGYLGDGVPDGWKLLTDTNDRLIQANSTANQTGGNLRGSHAHSIDSNTGIASDPNGQGAVTSGTLSTTYSAAYHYHHGTSVGTSDMFDVDTWPPYYAVNFIEKV